MMQKKKKQYNLNQMATNSLILLIFQIILTTKGAIPKNNCDGGVRPQSTHVNVNVTTTCPKLVFTRMQYILPTRLNDHSIGTFRSLNGSFAAVFVFGGYTDDDASNRIYKGLYGDTKWIEMETRTPTSPFIAWSHNSVTVHDLVYFMGIDDGVNSGNLYIFNMSSQRFINTSKVATMPIPSISGCMVTNEKYVYYVGGHLSKYIQMFDLLSSQWLARKYNISVSIKRSACAMISNKIYWFGGLTGDGYNTSTDAIYKYDINSEQETLVSNLSQELFNLRAIIGPDLNIYILGGGTQPNTNGSPEITPYDSNVHVFHVGNESVIYTTHLVGYGSTGHAVALLNFSIYTFGGYHHYAGRISLASGHVPFVQVSNAIEPFASFEFINRSNQGIYPGTLLKFTLKYDHDLFEEYATHFTVTIECEPLDISSHILTLDHKGDCVLHGTNSTQECEKGLSIPKTMKILKTTQNYTMRVVYSFGRSVFGETKMYLSRAVIDITIYLPSSIVPGQNITVNFTNNNNPDHLLIQPTSLIYMGGIQYLFEILIDHSNGACKMSVYKIEIPYMPKLMGNPSCTTGFPVSIHSNPKRIEMQLSSNDSVVNALVTIDIEQCTKGQYTNKDTSQCIDCEYNSYSLHKGNKCIKCDEKDRGYSCEGGYNVFVAQNHWICIRNYTVDNAEIFGKKNRDISIISVMCPPSYCCTQDTQYGCQLNNTDSLCNYGRDPDTVLCGACLKGYSEVFGSNTCQKCKNDWWTLCIPIISALLYAIIMGISQLDDDQNAKQPILFSELKTMLLRSMTYFMQSVYFFCSQQGLITYLSTVTSVFNLSPEYNGSGGGIYICFLSNLNAIHKQLLYLLVPVTVLLWIIIIKTVLKLCRCTQRAQSKSKHIEMVERRMFESKTIITRNRGFTFINRGIVVGNKWFLNYRSAFWNAILLAMGNVTCTMFKLISCSPIGAIKVHSYAGYERCHGFTWMMAFFGIIIIVFFWFRMFVRLYQMGEQRSKSDHFLYSLIKRYAPHRWYWEFVLIVRRIIVSIASAFLYSYRPISNWIVGVVLLFCLVLQLSYEPFESRIVDCFEAWCIFLSIISLLLIALLSDRNEQMYQVFLSVGLVIIILIPIIIYLYNVIRFVCYKCNNKQTPIEKNVISDVDLSLEEPLLQQTA
eukprot:757876_1